MNKKQQRVDDNVTLEGCKIIWKNFSGRKQTFNNEGDRNFALVLDADMADHLKKIGWNVKYREGRNEEEDPLHYLKVTVAFGDYPPAVYQVKTNGFLPLDDRTINMLDGMPIKHVDIVFSPYNWTHDGRTGVTAYLKKLYAVIEEDELDLKYAQLLDDAVE